MNKVVKNPKELQLSPLHQSLPTHITTTKYFGILDYLVIDANGV